MEKDDGVKKEAVAALTAPLGAPEKEPESGEKCNMKTVGEGAPEAREKCYKRTVGEDATFLEIAKDYFNQFKEMPPHKHWICLKNYFSHKCSSVFGKQKVEPVVKNETPEVAKPSAA